MGRIVARWLVVALALGAAFPAPASADPGGLPPDDARLQVWVHYDYMVAADGRSDAPDPAAIRMVVDAFAAHGIRLNIDEHHSAIPERRIVTLDSFFDYCGIPESDIAYLSMLKQQYFHPTANHDWHYAIFGYANACTGAGGIAEINGNDFIISLGHFRLERLPVAVRLRWTAGTFMHELGHNLGLRHGGDEDTNYKPNYLSVMNYQFQFNGIPFATTPGSTQVAGYRLDYSYHALAPLDENALDESVGLQSGTADISGVCDDFGCGRIPTTGPVDWNFDGDAQDRLATDLNFDSARNVLHSFDDWTLVRGILRGEVKRGPKTTVNEDLAERPEITSITPTSGPATGGTTVTIIGTHLGKVTTVLFGSQVATFTIVNTRTITAVAPPSPAHTVFGAPDAATVDVQAWSGPNPSITTSADLFSYTPVVPVVTSVTPDTIFNTTGARVTLRGKNFTGTTNVLLASRNDTLTQYDFTVVDDTTLTFRSQTNSYCGWCLSGAFQIYVSNAFGTSAGTTNIYLTFPPPIPPPAPPTVTSISPNGGPEAGGTSVVVRGSGFITSSNYGGFYLRFGSTSVGGTFIDDNTFVATSPPGTGAVDVTAQNTGGTSAVGPSTTFTYGTTPAAPPYPQITSFSPSAAVPGTAVTIRGTGLVAADGAPPTVIFAGGSWCLGPVSVNADGSLTAIVPSCARPSFYYIALSNANGYTLSSDLIALSGGADPVPTVTGISPTSGAPGTAVTITGQNLAFPMFGIWTYVNFGCGLFWPTLHADGTLTAVVPFCAQSGPVEVSTVFSGTWIAAPQSFTVLP